MRFTTIIRFIRLENDGNRNRHPLLQRRRMFALVIVLQLLSLACVAPGVATAATEDEQRFATHSKNLKWTDDGTFGALEMGLANDCAPTNGTKTGNCTATKTSTSSDCYSGSNRTTAAPPNTGDTGSNSTPTDRATDSGSTVTSSSDTHTTTVKQNTKASQKAERANTRGSNLLPDINSPIIAILGILCVIGGLIALAR
jgi:cobalamin biosynthesis Mg chelatase CobN